MAVFQNVAIVVVEPPAASSKTLPPSMDELGMALPKRLPLGSTSPFSHPFE
jgi:hypothetical protein